MKKREGSASKDQQGETREKWNNLYDEIPIESEYTKKLKEGIDIYKKKSSKPKKGKDLGALGQDASAYDRLQMYLPPNLKLPNAMKLPGSPGR